VAPLIYGEPHGGFRAVDFPTVYFFPILVSFLSFFYFKKFFQRKKILRKKRQKNFRENFEMENQRKKLESRKFFEKK